MDEQPNNTLSSPKEKRGITGKALNRARRMRHQASDAESLSWQRLRNRQMLGYKFRRQVVIEPHIVDFVCIEAKMIIEADGGQHAEQETYDIKRTARLISMGYTVLRFWNHEILGETDAVLERIASALLER